MSWDRSEIRHSSLMCPGFERDDDVLNLFQLVELLLLGLAEGAGLVQGQKVLRSSPGRAARIEIERIRTSFSSVDKDP